MCWWSKTEISVFILPEGKGNRGRRTMPQTCEVCREHTDVTSSEAAGVLSHKGRIFVGDLAKCYRSKFSKRKGGFLSCVCLFSSLGSLSPPWSFQEFWTFSPRPLSILCRAAWCWCFHQREVRGRIPCQNSGQRFSFM